MKDKHSPLTKFKLAVFGDPKQLIKRMTAKQYLAAQRSGTLGKFSSIELEYSKDSGNLFHSRTLIYVIKYDSIYDMP